MYSWLLSQVFWWPYWSHFVHSATNKDDKTTLCGSILVPSIDSICIVHNIQTCWFSQQWKGYRTFDFHFSSDLLTSNSNFPFGDFPVVLILCISKDISGQVWVATHIIRPVIHFRSVFYSWLNSFVKNLPLFMSIRDIDEAYRFWSIVIPSFVSLTPNLQNMKIPSSYQSHHAKETVHFHMYSLFPLG